MILFRCNAGPDVGLGHLVRCRALATALNRLGERCIMIGPDTKHIAPGDGDVFVDWIARDHWSSAENDARFLQDVASMQGAKTAVLDDYRVDTHYQAELRTAGFSWMQFDGAANRPLWASLVVNANPAVQASDYEGVVRNPEATLLLGPKYAVLRPEFSTIKHRDRLGPVQTVLVALGGGDDRGSILFVLSTLVPLTSTTVRFLVISGEHNPRNSEVRSWIEAHGRGRVSLEIDPPAVASLFASCDLAILGGGTTTYEAASCGLPMLLLALADNQLPQAKAWDDHGAAVFLGMLSEVNESHLSETFFALVNAEERRRVMVRQGRRLVDGQGACRVAKAVTERLMS